MTTSDDWDVRIYAGWWWLIRRRDDEPIMACWTRRHGWRVSDAIGRMNLHSDEQVKRLFRNPQRVQEIEHG